MQVAERRRAAQARRRRQARARLAALISVVLVGVVLVAVLVGSGSPPAPTKVAASHRKQISHRRKPNDAVKPASHTSASRADARPSLPVLDHSAVSSFQTFEHGQPGAIGIAVEPLVGHRTIALGDDRPAHGWSTTKVPVLLTLIDREGGVAKLTADQLSEAQLAITESDNQSILDLFDDLESADGGLRSASLAVQDVLRRGGDPDTTVATAPPPPGAVTTFGQTEWSPSDSVKFFRALAQSCLSSTADSDFVLHLMEHVISSESWGLGSAGLRDTVAFKGGWGPEPDGAYLVRQSGIIDPGSSSGAAVAIVAYPPAGSDSFEVGTEMVTAAAQWVAKHVVLSPRVGARC